MIGQHLSSGQTVKWAFSGMLALTIGCVQCARPTAANTSPMMPPPVVFAFEGGSLLIDALSRGALRKLEDAASGYGKTAFLISTAVEKADTDFAQARADMVVQAMLVDGVLPAHIYVEVLDWEQQASAWKGAMKALNGKPVETPAPQPRTRLKVRVYISPNDPPLRSTMAPLD